MERHISCAGRRQSSIKLIVAKQYMSRETGSPYEYIAWSPIGNKMNI